VLSGLREQLVDKRIGVIRLECLLYRACSTIERSKKGCTLSFHQKGDDVGGEVVEAE